MTMVRLTCLTELILAEEILSLQGKQRRLLENPRKMCMLTVGTDLHERYPSFATKGIVSESAAQPQHDEHHHDGLPKRKASDAVPGESGGSKRAKRAKLELYRPGIDVPAQLRPRFERIGKGKMHCLIALRDG